MKRLLKIVGIVLLICAIVLYFVAGHVQEEAKPRTVSFGIVADGGYMQTGSGSIGGNSEAVNEMQWLKVIAVMSGIAGASSIVAATFIKEKNRY